MRTDVEATRVTPISDQSSFTVEGAGRSFTCPDWKEQGLFGFSERDQRTRPFDLLRSQILKAMRANDWRILGVTSATPGVGKTFVVSNLAASLSRLPEVDTYLFDLDLRRGSVAERFGIEPEKGLNSYFQGLQDTLTDLSFSVQGTRLNIYPCVPDDHSSSEQLAGSRLRALVDAMRALPRESVCLCDLPPVFANDDAIIVTREIDAYLLVVEDGVSTSRQLKSVIQLLSPTPCIGTVLNRYRIGLTVDEFGYGYGQYSKYEAYYS